MKRCWLSNTGSIPVVSIAVVIQVLTDEGVASATEPGLAGTGLRADVGKDR